ncbi:MAG: PorV/PorQ family protein [Candidatus Cloacimonetes bacterium]|nr:PorV/PorQ family protein [Candidatus Cloacimonadota bacterium]
MKKYICIIALVILLPLLLSAEIFPKVGTAGVQFLKLGIDARAIGMGEAYTAVTDDISSVYWNPAGLSLNTQNQVFYSHTEWLAEIQHEYFAVSHYFDFGVLAFSMSYLHMPEMEVITEESWVPTGEMFNCYDLAAGLTYSYQFTDKFSFGITGKFIREELDEYPANGLSVDLGTLYNAGWNNITIGMAMRNFGPDMEFNIDEDGDGLYDEDVFDLLDNDGDGLIDEDREEMPFKLPMNFSLGLAGDLYRSDDDSSYLIASLQLDSYVDRQETYNLGAEYKIGKLCLRSGYQFEYDAAGFSAGLGFIIPTSSFIVMLDYSYSDYGDLTESFMLTPQRFTIKLLY